MKARFLLILLFPLLILAQNETVTFSQPGGVYNDSFSLALSCERPGHHIRFTTNGNIPNEYSRKYTGPLFLNQAMLPTSDIYQIQISPSEDIFTPDSILKAIVIRAAVFNEQNKRVGPVVTQTYFIETMGCEFHALPVVSICADSLSLFSYDTGIFVPGIHWDPANPNLSGNYYQKGDEWERVINIEFYEHNHQGFNQTAGIRTHGGNSRRIPQKSFKVYARAEYGNKNFNYPIFSNPDITKYKRLVFKPFASSWTEAGIQDWLAEKIANNLKVDALASRPALVFLNGEYWGIYYIEEKADERYLESHHGIDKDDINIIAQWWEVENGNDEHFKQFYEWMETADLTDDNQYQYVTQMLDIEETIDYLLLELFTANQDWPANNLRCWQAGNGPWRWLFYDGDACFNRYFGVYGNATYEGSNTWPSSTHSTLFFRKLFQNDSFRKAYYTRLTELNQSYFSYHYTQTLYNEILNLLENHIERQIERFNKPADRKEWERDMTVIDKFLEDRVEQFHKKTLTFFGYEEKPKISLLTCQPNPARCGESIELHLEVQNAGVGCAEIYQISGQLLNRSYQFYTKGPNCHKITVPSKPGFYIIKIENESIKILVL